MQTNTIWIGAGLIVILVGAYVLLAHPSAPGGGPVACTQEAKLCPDGSAVGRTGPNCEFAPCPSTPSSPSPQPGPQPQPGPKPGGPIACTADAMQCPDGTWVGRTGPGCQFVCPGTGASTRVEAGLNESAGAKGVTITPLEVLEDSRCPTDVQCIWAGTVRLRARLESPSGTSQMTFILGTPITTETQTVTLMEVQPQPKAGTPISKEEYQFTFEIKKR